MASLTVDDISKEYTTSADPLRILRRIKFKMDAGENLAVLGPSGSGKSTLLHVLGALDPPTSGTIRLNDKDPYELDEHDLAEFRNKNIGFIFQDHHLLPQLTVLENTLIPVMAEGPVDSASQQRARELLDRVGLSERLDHRPAELSGGERERVAVARALIREPELLLADEPTGNLDRKTAGQVAELLLDLQEKAILIVVTHSQQMADLMQRRVYLQDGLLAQEA